MKQKKTVAAAATMYAEKVLSNKDEQANRSSLDTKTFIQSNLGCMFTKLFFFSCFCYARFMVSKPFLASLVLTACGSEQFHESTYILTG